MSDDEKCCEAAGAPVFSVEEPRTTALGIPCPWSGNDDEATDWRYRLWFQLYLRSRVARHWLGLHDWQGTPDPARRRCSWCGAAS